MYGLQARGFNGEPRATSTEDLVDQIVRVQPQGPYNVLGWSLGGPIAHAMAAEQHTEFMTRYTSPMFRGDLVFFCALLDQQTRERRQLDVGLDVQWRDYVDGTVRRFKIECAHNEMMWPQNAIQISRIINEIIKSAR